MIGREPPEGGPTAGPTVSAAVDPASAGGGVTRPPEGGPTAVGSDALALGI